MSDIRLRAKTSPWQMKSPTEAGFAFGECEHDLVWRFWKGGTARVSSVAPSDRLSPLQFLLGVRVLLLELVQQRAECRPNVRIEFVPELSRKGE